MLALLTSLLRRLTSGALHLAPRPGRPLATCTQAATRLLPLVTQPRPRVISNPAPLPDNLPIEVMTSICSLPDMVLTGRHSIIIMMMTSSRPHDTLSDDPVTGSLMLARSSKAHRRMHANAEHNNNNNNLRQGTFRHQLSETHGPSCEEKELTLE